MPLPSHSADTAQPFLILTLGVSGVQEYRSTDICPCLRILPTPRSPFLILTLGVSGVQEYRSTDICPCLRILLTLRSHSLIPNS